MSLKAVIFDLDGVLTDTAEYHYRGWQRMADEEGLPFSREKNEQLRGVSRQRSLELILEGRTIPPEKFEELLVRKNHYYQEMLAEISADQLLPGIPALLDELRSTGVLLAVGSASKNAKTVLQALGIFDQFAVIADGYSVTHAKPAPDLFLYAAAQMGLAPYECVVVEDAESGIDAALTGGFGTVGIGPEERVGHAHLRLDDTSGLTLALLQSARHRANNWQVHETTWNPAKQHHRETVYTVGNGLLASRGVLEEGYPDEWRTTFMHGIFDDVPVSFTEIANLPDWMNLTILLDGERFRMDEGKLVEYHRVLDLRSGLLTRTVLWESQQGKQTHLRFERFISYLDRHLVGIRLQITPDNWEGQVEIRSTLFGLSDNQGLLHWQTITQGDFNNGIYLHSRTRASRMEVALVSNVTLLDGKATVDYWDVTHQPTQRLVTEARRGTPLTLTKMVTIVDSCHSKNPLQAAQQILTESRQRDFDSHLARSVRGWVARWRTSDVEIDGDDEAQLATRHGIFQILAVGPQREEDNVSIGAKTLSGFGYRGHVFWDTELFILPLFSFTQPDIARNLLLYRYNRLDAARRKATANGFEGAQFPWESAVTGDEVTPTWVTDWTDRTKLVRIWTGDIEIHITADIAYGVMQYWWATNDDEFMQAYGAELILSGANFWASRAEWNEAEQRYEFNDVIGPDEYHDHVDNNVFTNSMARWHLQTALWLLEWLEQNAPAKGQELRVQLAIDATLLEKWRHVIAHIWILEDPASGLMEQFQGYFQLRDVNLAEYEPRTRSMHELLGIEGANKAQIIKQPDVMMLLFLQRGARSPEQIRVNWDYYNSRTDHTYGSSLGPAITAIMACEMGDPNVAYEHFMRAARADLFDVRGNASDGIHAASAGGLWQAAALGFGGLRVYDHEWSVTPRLPAHWQRLTYSFYCNGQLRRVEVYADGSHQVLSS
jgi:beta-phosphoglucomutase